jgi:hypothetical protein
LLRASTAVADGEQVLLLASIRSRGNCYFRSVLATPRRPGHPVEPKTNADST